MKRRYWMEIHCAVALQSVHAAFFLMVTVSDGKKNYTILNINQNLTKE